MEEEIEYHTATNVKDLVRTTRSVIICWRCRGYGIVEERQFMGHTSGYVPVNKICPVCDGKGRVVEVVEKRYEAVD